MMGVILAGGKSKRFGEDKLLYRVDGKPLILHTTERLLKARLVEDVLIVTSKERREKFEDLGFSVLVDELLIGPIGGVYISLKEVGDAFVVAGDMPRINPSFVDLIIGTFYKSESLVCVPVWENGYMEPLHAAYSKDFAEVLRKAIEREEYSLNQAIRGVNFCEIEIENLPPEFGESLFNINKKSDLKSAQLLGQNHVLF
ncbi:hypothetical protein PAP_01390 [Palaeococcus pacificus DY20341]|uniref:Probable molybdenum cofactor guanylyltransferase n=1 Tax=Palaeococcus pacificus DY20341 TaxID=1343739 RepID=A0A075LW77_9EURY|nr:molybdenum cofactor guanylyltransferase MobA [Palaeococcus pacificus]AIF68718.1 hypothetical protein PAP_01390 [Palaeococcus pacificus DY20341]